MKVIKTDDRDFNTFIASRRAKTSTVTDDIEKTVKMILNDVRQQGDSALLSYTEKFDGHTDITVTQEIIQNACDQLKPDILSSLQLSFKRIEAFHRKQIQNSWIHTDEQGEILGQVVRPIHRVGIYVPGGKAVYPSSVLMNAIPARVAGVEEIIMVTPGSPSGIHPLLCAAAQLCGITKIFKIGGAQAVAALAYGTATIPKVDKIVGPGNIYVATAKRFVFGEVDIDMIAGPSEILIISDGSGPAEWVAADMLSQAEHDEMASSVLITTNETFARKVEAEINLQVKELPKREIAHKSIATYGAIIIANSLQEAVALTNDIAPEHLELYVERPWDLLPDIKNAGAVFMGHITPEPVGDYIAGPNHVLPTGGTARFFSPLSVDDFVKKISLISYNQNALHCVGDDVMRLARSEELEAHARSIQKRLKDIR